MGTTGMEQYEAANKKAIRAYRTAMNHGEYPYLQALDDFLPYEKTGGERYVGVIEIPLRLVAGTKTAGRQNSFANNFMPLLGSDSEFAMKWANLCESQMEEGLRDPIVAYEYMHRFYVMEGNKRVSVMKSLEAAKITAKVTRILPIRTEETENKIYYEFLDFYQDTECYDIWFSQSGSFEQLANYYNYQIGETWSEDNRKDLRSEYLTFRKEYKAKGGDKLNMTTGDAFLVYIDMFPAWQLQTLSADQIRANITKIWDQFVTVAQDNAIKLVLEPQKEKTSGNNGFFNKLLGGGDAKKKMSIAFIYEKTVEDSAWNYAHEMGRMYLEQKFGDRVSTTVYERAEYADDSEDLIERAISDGHDMIFTVAAQLANASAKAAIEHPKVKILNCSTNSMYRAIRTYYCRIYETKFLLGVIAGAMTESGHIGYLADYPIYSTIANINAFALGAQMVNPRAHIHLHWNCEDAQPSELEHWPQDVDMVADQDWIIPERPTRKYGLYQKKGDEIVNIAASMCHWGKMYEWIIRSIWDHTWKVDDEENKNQQALNYWWGFSAGVLELVCSQKVPRSTKALVDILTETLRRGDISPFDGEWLTQDGTVINNASTHIGPEAIYKMNYLASNVEGRIPNLEELKPEAREFVKLQGGL